MTDAQVDRACDTLKRAIEAAENSNQAGEDFVMAAAAAPDLLSIVERFVALPSGAWHPERHAADEAELMTEAKAAIARAKGGAL